MCILIHTRSYSTRWPPRSPLRSRRRHAYTTRYHAEIYSLVIHHTPLAYDATLHDAPLYAPYCRLYCKRKAVLLCSRFVYTLVCRYVSYMVCYTTAVPHWQIRCTLLSRPLGISCTTGGTCAFTHHQVAVRTSMPSKRVGTRYCCTISGGASPCLSLLALAREMLTLEEKDAVAMHHSLEYARACRVYL